MFASGYAHLLSCANSSLGCLKIFSWFQQPILGAGDEVALCKSVGLFEVEKFLRAEGKPFPPQAARSALFVHHDEIR